MIALWGTVVAALIAAILGPWVKGRIDQRKAERGEGISAKATLATSVDKRLDELLERYTGDINDLRGQVRESNGRIRQLEQEVAEWRSGLHGVPGVWIAVPSSVWEYVRSMLPDLPPTRFPGEIGAVPHDG